MLVLMKFKTPTGEKKQIHVHVHPVGTEDATPSVVAHSPHDNFLNYHVGAVTVNNKVSQTKQWTNVTEELKTHTAYNPVVNRGICHVAETGYLFPRQIIYLDNASNTFRMIQVLVVCMDESKNLGSTPSQNAAQAEASFNSFHALGRYAVITVESQLSNPYLEQNRVLLKMVKRLIHSISESLNKFNASRKACHLWQVQLRRHREALEEFVAGEAAELEYTNKLNATGQPWTEEEDKELRKLELHSARMRYLTALTLHDIMSNGEDGQKLAKQMCKPLGYVEELQCHFYSMIKVLEKVLP